MSASRIKHKKRKVEGPEPKVQKRRKTLNALSAPLNETLSSGERSPDLAPVDSHEAATTSVSGSGKSLVSHPPVLCGAPTTLLS